MVSTTGFTRFGKVYLWAVIAAGFAVFAPRSTTWLRNQSAPSGLSWRRSPSSVVQRQSGCLPRPPRSPSRRPSSLPRYCSTAGGRHCHRRPRWPRHLVLDLQAVRRASPCSLQHVGARRVGLVSPHISSFASRNRPLVQGRRPHAILPALVLFALTYFALNSWLITLVIALERQLNPVKIWTNNFVWLVAELLRGASVAVPLRWLQPHDRLRLRRRHRASAARSCTSRSKPQWAGLKTPTSTWNK